MDFLGFSHEGCFGGSRSHYDTPAGGWRLGDSAMSGRRSKNANTSRSSKHKVKPVRAKKQSSMQRDLMKSIVARKAEIKIAEKKMVERKKAVSKNSCSDLWQLPLNLTPSPKDNSRPDSRASSMMWWDDDTEVTGFDEDPAFLDFDTIEPSFKVNLCGPQLDLSECTIEPSNISESSCISTTRNMHQSGNDWRTKIKQFNPSESRSSVYESGVRSMTDDSRSNHRCDKYNVDLSESSCVTSLQNSVVDSYVAEKLDAFDDAEASQQDKFLEKLIRQNAMLKKTNKQLKSKIDGSSRSSFTSEYDMSRSSNRKRDGWSKQVKLGNLFNEKLMISS